MPSVGVIGGGTAGYVAGLTLKRFLPTWDITVVESSSIPVIGVGEATTSDIVPFLHSILDIDVVELYEAVLPTWKLGIRFEWGRPEPYHFNYPFDGSTEDGAMLFDGRSNDCTFLSMLMDRDGGLVVGSESPADAVAPLRGYPFAYHIDNKRFIAFLADCARRRGVHHRDLKIVGAERSATGEGIASVTSSSGETLAFDYFVDCTGFRSLLLEKTLGSQFISYAPSLFTDSAIAAEAPNGGVVRPYTVATTMQAGWCWTIPQRDDDHLGYVFASAHLSDEDAERELRSTFDVGDTRVVRFRSGRHEHFCIGNVAAIGNSYGFVEPLESTGIFVICRQALLLALQLHHGGALTAEFAAIANRAVGEVWDQIRWFLAIHYRFNRRVDSSFWRECATSCDISGVEHVVDRFVRQGPLSAGGAEGRARGGLNFTSFGYDVLLHGQGLVAPVRPTHEQQEQWAERKASNRAMVATALDHGAALEVLGEADPEVLRDHVIHEDSWVSKYAVILQRLHEPQALKWWRARGALFYSGSV